MKMFPSSNRREIELLEGMVNKSGGAMLFLSKAVSVEPRALMMEVAC